MAIIIILLAAAIGIGYTMYTGKPNNVVEEVAEVVIEKELGLPDGSVDLTPSDWGKK